MKNDIKAVLFTTILLSPLSYFLNIYFDQEYVPFYYWILITSISSSVGIIVWTLFGLLFSKLRGKFQK